MLLLGDDPVHGPRAPVPPGARRALCIFAGVALGIMLVYWLHGHGVALPSGVWLGGAGLLTATGLVIGARWSGRVMLLGVVLASSGWTSLRWFEPPAQSLAVRMPPDRGYGQRTPIEVRVLVSSVARRGSHAAGELADLAPWGGRPWILEAEVQSVRTDRGWSLASGGLFVLVPGETAPDAQPGDILELIGLFAPVRMPLNPGTTDGRLWAAERGRVGSLTLTQGSTLNRVGEAKGVDAIAARWTRAHHSLRERSRSALGKDDDAAPDPARSVVLALVLGERDPRSADIQAAFARQGVAHLLAISGFHLLLIAGAALFAVRTLTGGRLGRIEPLLVAALIVAYVLIVPARPPIVRAALMALALLGAEAAGRRYHGLGIIAWVGVAMLAARPTDLFDAGFQLSFLMTGSLLWLGGRVDAVIAGRGLDSVGRPPDLYEPRWWWNSVRMPFSASVLCWVVGAPFVVSVFGWLSPMAIISTLVLLPMVALLLISGALLVAFSIAGVDIGGSHWIEMAGSWAAGYVLTVDTWGWSTWRLPSLPAWLGWTGTALALAWIGGSQPMRRWLQALTIVWCLAVGVAWIGPRVSGPELRLDTFAVGDGTCHIVRSRGEVLLWDAGSTRPGIGVWELPRAMRAVGVGRVRTAVITHADFDHYSALPDLIGPLGIERVLVAPEFEERRSSPAVGRFYQAMEERGVQIETISAGDRIKLGRATIEVLHPALGQSFARSNDASLVARFTTPGGGSMLLTGDIQADAMRALEDSDVTAQVLELPHHGSVIPAARGFVDRVQPAVILQSTGPSRAGNERWNIARPGRIWRTTATDGWICTEFWKGRARVRSLHAPTENIEW